MRVCVCVCVAEGLHYAQVKILNWDFYQGGSLPALTLAGWRAACGKVPTVATMRTWSLQ